VPDQAPDNRDPELVGLALLGMADGRRRMQSPPPRLSQVADSMNGELDVPDYGTPAAVAARERLADGQ
jgi:hypothetical protein